VGTQYRAAVVLAFSIIVGGAGEAARPADVVAVGPMAHNFIMGYEALSAQFTSVADPARWAYVTALLFLGDNFCDGGVRSPVVKIERPSLPEAIFWNWPGASLVFRGGPLFVPECPCLASERGTWVMRFTARAPDFLALALPARRPLFRRRRRLPRYG